MQLLALRTVLVATDLEATSVSALETAHRLAAAAGATVHVVHVVDDATVTSPADVEQTAARFLGDAGLGSLAGRFHVATGDPAPAIRLLADRLTANVIVLGPHRAERTPADGRVIGSTALAVVTNAAAPCLVVASPLRLPVERIVVPVDLSDTARGALAIALSWASALRSTRADSSADVSTKTSLTALFVHRSSGSESTPITSQAFERELDRVRATAGSWSGVSIDGEVIRGREVARAIASFSDERRADLVVTGTRGLGFDHVGRLGSVSGELLRLLTTPLLLVPPAIWMAHARSA